MCPHSLAQLQFKMKQHLWTEAKKHLYPRSHLKGLAGRLMFWNGSLVRMLKERKGSEMKQATSHVSPTAR